MQSIRALFSFEGRYRTLHLTWVAFFLTFVVWFNLAPFATTIKAQLGLTKAQMGALAKAKGPAFERLFLTGMIQHHEGAIAMVKTLFTTTGAAQNTAIFRFASDVDADQRAEITRMRAMLTRLPAR